MNGEEELLEAEALTPEATASATVRVSLDGYDWLFTLRAFGSETKAPANLIDRMNWVNEKFNSIGGKPIFGKNTQASAPAKEESKKEPKKKPCPIHEGEFLYRRTNKETGQSWYSHQPEDSDEWCRGE